MACLCLLLSISLLLSLCCAAADDDSVIVDLARLHIALRRHDSGIQLLRQAISLRPDIPLYHCLLGVSLLQVSAACRSCGDLIRDCDAVGACVRAGTAVVVDDVCRERVDVSCEQATLGVDAEQRRGRRVAESPAAGDMASQRLRRCTPAVSGVPPISPAVSSSALHHMPVLFTAQRVLCVPSRDGVVLSAVSAGWDPCSSSWVDPATPSRTSSSTSCCAPSPPSATCYPGWLSVSPTTSVLLARFSGLTVEPAFTRRGVSVSVCSTPTPRRSSEWHCEHYPRFPQQCPSRHIGRR